MNMSVTDRVISSAENCCSRVCFTKQTENKDSAAKLVRYLRLRPLYDLVSGGGWQPIQHPESELLPD